MEGLKKRDNSETNFKVDRHLSAENCPPAASPLFPDTILPVNSCITRDSTVTSSSWELHPSLKLKNTVFCYVCLTIYILVFTLVLSFIESLKNVPYSVLFLLTQIITTCSKLTMACSWQNKNIYNKSMWSYVGTTHL